MKQALLILTFIISCWIAANGQVGIGTSNPHSSSLLDISSTSKGMLVPRMDSAQRVAIASPAVGLLVFQTNGVSPGFYFYSGSTTGWVSIRQNHYVGEMFGGGIICYVDASGQHGLICSLVDVSGSSAWSSSSTPVGAGAQSFWNGMANTAAAMAQSPSSGAVVDCDGYTNEDYGTGQFSDWYLPAADEFRQLIINRYPVDKGIDMKGILDTAPISENIYWTSTEDPGGGAFAFDVSLNFAYSESKSTGYYVRAVRSF